MDVIIPTVVDADLSSFYSIQDPSPGPERSYELKEIVLRALHELTEKKKKIILLLMWGLEPKNVAQQLKTNEMAITRAKRSFHASLIDNGYE